MAGGSAGNLTLFGNSVVLNNGSVQAEASAGNKGNVTIDSRDVLLLRQGAAITTNATENATDGNITLNSPVIVGLENSDISANAVAGDGGNIRLVTQGLVGLEFRDQLTPQSDITASSDTGVDGVVEIESPNVDADSGLVELPKNLEDSSDQVFASCNNTAAGNQFVSSGRGGLASNPQQTLASDSVWLDFRTSLDVSPVQREPESASDENRHTGSDHNWVQRQSEAIPTLQEASAWSLNEKGQVETVG